MAHVRYLDCQWKRFVTGQLIKLRLAIYVWSKKRKTSILDEFCQEQSHAYCFSMKQLSGRKVKGSILQQQQ